MTDTKPKIRVFYVATPSYTQYSPLPSSAVLNGAQRGRCRRGGAGHHSVHQGPHREERAVEQRGGRGHRVGRCGGPDQQRARPRRQQHADAERFPQAPPLLRPRAKHAPAVSGRGSDVRASVCARRADVAAEKNDDFFMPRQLQNWCDMRAGTPRALDSVSGEIRGAVDMGQ